MSATSHFHGKTPFGQKDGRILLPAEVESGLACDCICPGCGAQLVAKKGEKVAWHFAHYNANPTVHCLESTLHAAAKQVLADAKWLWVPAMVIRVNGLAADGARHTLTKQLSPARIIRFDDCRKEVWEDGGRITERLIMMGG